MSSIISSPIPKPSLDKDSIVINQRNNESYIVYLKPKFEVGDLYFHSSMFLVTEIQGDNITIIDSGLCSPIEETYNIDSFGICEKVCFSKLSITYVRYPLQDLSGLTVDTVKPVDIVMLKDNEMPHIVYKVTEKDIHFFVNGVRTSLSKEEFKDKFKAFVILNCYVYEEDNHELFKRILG